MIQILVRRLYLLSFKLNMLTWEGDQCFIVSTFAQNHGAWPKKHRQRSAPERYGFAFLPGSFKPVQNSPKLCCVKFMDFIVETKTSKDTSWFPKLFFAKTQVFQWSMVPASGIRTTVAGPFRGFLLRPLSNQMVTSRRRSKSTEDLFHPSL